MGRPWQGEQEWLNWRAGESTFKKGSPAQIRAPSPLCYPHWKLYPLPHRLIALTATLPRECVVGMVDLGSVVKISTSEVQTDRLLYNCARPLPSHWPLVMSASALA